MIEEDLIINFTPTGMVPTKNHTPHVPISPQEIIEQIIEVYEIGITLTHIHARDENGTPSYKAEIYDEIISGIRRYCPDLVICVSLSGRNFPELQQRTDALQLYPDMGSLTLSSLNFANQASVNSPEIIHGLINEMDKYGVKPELECFDIGMINYSKYLIRKGMLKPPYYFNLLFGNIAGAQVNPLHIGLLVNDLPQESYWALAGLGNGQLKANTIAIALGGGVRVGVEDNIWFDQKRTTLATNRELVSRIHVIAEIFERKIMKPSVLGNAGFYNQKRKKALQMNVQS